MKKKYIDFDVPEDHEIFRGNYDISSIIDLIWELSIPPYEAWLILPQCFTKTNIEANLKQLKERLPDRYFQVLRGSILVHKWSHSYKDIDHPILSHIVENGDFDPKFKEGIEILKKYFADSDDKT